MFRYLYICFRMRGGLWCFIVLTVSEFLHGKTHDIQHAKLVDYVTHI